MLHRIRVSLAPGRPIQQCRSTKYQSTACTLHAGGHARPHNVQIKSIHPIPAQQQLSVGCRAIVHMGFVGCSRQSSGNVEKKTDANGTWFLWLAKSRLQEPLMHLADKYSYSYDIVSNCLVSCQSIVSDLSHTPPRLGFPIRN